MKSKYSIEAGFRLALLLAMPVMGAGCSLDTADSEAIDESESAMTIGQPNGTITTTLHAGFVLGDDTIFSTLLRDPLRASGDASTASSVSFFTILPDIPTNFAKLNAAQKVEQVQVDPGLAPGFPAAFRAKTANQYALIRFNWSKAPLPNSPDLRRVNSWSWSILNDLRSSHSGCSSIEKLRHPNCVSAIRRVCVNRGFTMGFAQAAGGVTAILAGCFNAGRVDNLTEAALKTHHPDCRFTDSQSPSCMAAAHRYCNTQGFGIGLPGEPLGSGFQVACVTAGRYGDVPITTLQRFHPACQVGASQSFQCLTAASFYCMSRGFLGGVSQEVGTTTLGIGCYAMSTSDELMIDI